MPHHKRRALLALCIAVAFCGCTTPKHTDLLVFGTNTQFGVSVAADATSTPGINVGYKRQELVMMPLYVNGQQSRLAPDDDADIGTTTTENKYTGTDGGDPAKTDTYSVLASFGASGSGETSGKAKVGIAQYFATGLAARTLAFAGGALINTGDKAAESAGETAKAAAAATTTSVNLGTTQDTRRANLAMVGTVYHSLEGMNTDPEAQAHVVKMKNVDASAEATGFTEYRRPGPALNVVSTQAKPALAKGHDFSSLVDYHADLNDSVAVLEASLRPQTELKVKEGDADPASVSDDFLKQAMADLTKQKKHLADLDKKVGQEPAIVGAVQYYSTKLITTTAAAK